MAKSMFATLASLLACCVVTCKTSATEIPVRVDGCAILARAVYSEVSAAALFGPGRSGPWPIDAGHGEIAICTTAAKTVSRAFTTAMSSAGYEVYWGGGLTESGGYCPNGYLSRCHPNRDGRLTPDDGADSKFVQEFWLVVSRSVMRQMFNPFSSDEVRFRDGDLKLQLGLSLRTVNAGKRR